MENMNIHAQTKTGEDLATNGNVKRVDAIKLMQPRKCYYNIKDVNTNP